MPHTLFIAERTRRYLDPSWKLGEVMPATDCSNLCSGPAKQRCFYHLFTEPRKVDKHNSSDQWKFFRKKLLRLLKDAIRLSGKKALLGANDYVRLKQYAHGNAPGVAKLIGFGVDSFCC
jgi:hypothetical protein